MTGQAALAGNNDEDEHLKSLSSYMDVISQLERMHRLLLDMIKDEFSRKRIVEINPVQGLLLYNVGLEVVSAGELRSRGYYQGSNVSYNLKKLVEVGYMQYERSEIDKRSVDVSLSEKGREIHELVTAVFTKSFLDLRKNGVWMPGDCRQTRDNLKLLERFWVSQIRFIY